MSYSCVYYRRNLMTQHFPYVRVPSMAEHLIRTPHAHGDMSDIQAFPIRPLQPIFFLRKVHHNYITTYFPSLSHSSCAVLCFTEAFSLEKQRGSHAIFFSDFLGHCIFFSIDMTKQYFGVNCRLYGRLFA